MRGCWANQKCWGRNTTFFSRQFWVCCAGMNCDVKNCERKLPHIFSIFISSHFPHQTQRKLHKSAEIIIVAFAHGNTRSYCWEEGTLRTTRGRKFMKRITKLIHNETISTKLQAEFFIFSYIFNADAAFVRDKYFIFFLPPFPYTQNLHTVNNIMWKTWTNWRNSQRRETFFSSPQNARQTFLS